MSGSGDTGGSSSDLEHELKRTIQGEVRFDRGSRALYASDASNYRQVPVGLVVPQTADDVRAAVAACRKYGAPVLPRGAGTSLAGQCCNVAVVLDFTKYMNRILEINPVARTARVEPGVVLDSLRQQAERAHGLTFGPDPSTHNRCTLGGMIGNNSCGTHSILAGKTVDNVDQLHILLYDGTEMTVGATSPGDLSSFLGEPGRKREIYSKLLTLRDRYGDLVRARYPRIPRRVSGYNLDQLLPEHGLHVARALVGSEGTCAIVLEATVRLIPNPRHRTLVGLGYDDTFAAADQVPEILPFHPIGLEGFEGAMVDGLRKKGAPNLELVPEGRGILLVELASEEPGESRRVAEQLVERLTSGRSQPRARVYTDAEAAAVWRIRESGPRAASNMPGAPPRWEGWDDASVAPQRLGPYLRDLRRLLDEFHYDAAFYGHFGEGCIHMQVSFDLQSDPGVRRYADFIDRAADLVVSYGGSLSGEHGDGQSRGALLPKMFGEELVGAFREFKSVWDPDNKLNPHKLVDAYLPTENLRLGASYSPPDLPTRFQFPDDGRSLAKASLRCLGLGACRKHEGGTMCPSYAVTLEEEHSTRGRARMLFEMLQGDILADGWQDEHVKQAFDLCLSCKACKSECPTNVDIATYKAEFLSHYYERRWRPLHAYAFGLIDKWARAASIAPALANFINLAPGSRAIVRGVLDLARERALPPFANVSFRKWARRRGVPTVWSTGSNAARTDASPRNTPARRVILWADTFNNYFHPETARAALEVLERAGFSVSIPRAHLCCGRPLYDFGMLDRAADYLRRVMQALGPEIDEGRPIVVLEPSCASVFRDELRNLFPSDARAIGLSKQTFLLGEFLAQHAADYAPPRLPRRVLLHHHCHQKAVMKTAPDAALLRRMGADVQTLDAGCCGMAGPFGFQADRFPVSQAIGERALLPAVRQAEADTVIVSDGFSCREQIVQSAGRRAIHLAEVLQLASSRATNGS